MKACPQTNSQSVWEHGVSVQNYLFDLINHLETGEQTKYQWRLPEWLLEHKQFILSNLVSKEDLEIYTLYHDCGKPLCIEYDAEERRHFPNHAEVSYNTFKSLFDNETVADLILHDMDLHCLKAEGIDDFIKNTNNIPALMITALAELHSNASMFGGIESDSFKIKYKSLEKRSKQIIQKIKI